MKKFKKEYKVLFGKQVNFMGYKTGGIFGMYCENVRVYKFGIYRLIGFQYTVRWGYNY